MRLDELEKSALRHALENVPGEVYLFGSRTDDSRKGGDIDLLVFSSESPYMLSRDIALRFFKVCEEKIDVVVMDKDNLTQDQQAFLNTIEMEPLKL